MIQSICSRCYPGTAQRPGEAGNKPLGPSCAPQRGNQGREDSHNAPPPFAPTYLFPSASLAKGTTLVLQYIDHCTVSVISQRQLLVGYGKNRARGLCVCVCFFGEELRSVGAAVPC